MRVRVEECDGDGEAAPGCPARYCDPATATDAAVGGQQQRERLQREAEELLCSGLLAEAQREAAERGAAPLGRRGQRDWCDSDALLPAPASPPPGAGAAPAGQGSGDGAAPPHQPPPLAEAIDVARQLGQDLQRMEQWRMTQPPEPQAADWERRAGGPPALGEGRAPDEREAAPRRSPLRGIAAVEEAHNRAQLELHRAYNRSNPVPVRPSRSRPPPPGYPPLDDSTSDDSD
eukprot:TRINITY_DN70498_c0_g1_i1.p2 TRINITY_DN70498_c0_g1~~TRINITY_DN70498_c0_g1_i1.p2  ORF type:complete len:257 (+),score=67.12 TRINITY_DN70498_c0_g1_i1:77-772(+)